MIVNSYNALQFISLINKNICIERRIKTNLQFPLYSYSKPEPSKCTIYSYKRKVINYFIFLTHYFGCIAIMPNNTVLLGVSSSVNTFWISNQGCNGLVQRPYNNLAITMSPLKTTPPKIGTSRHPKRRTFFYVTVC